MANIKVGDKVVRSLDFAIIQDTVVDIHPNTITLEIYGRRQFPHHWRIAVPATIARIEAFFKEAELLRGKANEFYRTMPKVEL